MRLTKNFISIEDFDRDLLSELIVTASLYKKGDLTDKPLLDKNIAMLFMNNSLRTRLSFELAVRQLGGHPSIISSGSDTWNLECRKGAKMDGDKPEHVIDATRVLSSYYDAICVRSFPTLVGLAEDMSEPVLSAFAANTNAPVINMESCMSHPCQALADMLTIQEASGGNRKVKIAVYWSYHPKRLPLAVTLSLLQAAVAFNDIVNEVVVVAPEPYFIPDTITAAAKGVRFVRDITDAGHDIDFIYVKSWASPLYYNDPQADMAARRDHTDRIVDSRLMQQFQGARVMHCMPFRRNVEMTDEVADSDANLMYLQAENRIHVQKAVLKHFAGGK